MTVSNQGSNSHKPGRVAATRAIGFFVLWLTLAGASPADLPVGIVAAGLATWASLRLLPAGQWSLRPVALARLGLRFLYQSIVAGIDVAWRALDPRLPLRPGFVTYPVGFPPGTARNVFATLTSLLPGHGAGRRRRRTSRLSLPRRRSAGGGAAGRGGSRAVAGARAMTEFLTAALGFILAMLALGLVRVLRGPGDADRMMAAQLIGTGGIAALLLLGVVSGVPAAIDVALTLALLATFASIAFVKKGPPRWRRMTPDRRRADELRARHPDDRRRLGRRLLLSRRHRRAASLSRYADATARAHQGRQSRPRSRRARAVAAGRKPA